MANIEIVASYSRKISHELYGGAPYESSDHFCSLKRTIEEKDYEDENYEKISILFRLLSDEVKSLVDEKVAEEIAAMSGGLPPKEFHKLLDGYLKNDHIEANADIWDSLSPFQRLIFQTIKKSKKRVTSTN